MPADDRDPDSDSDRDPDRDDVLAARRGDREAYARLVGRHLPRVHDLARRLLRDAQEAEDVASIVFLNAWRGLDGFDASRPFRNWLLRIATNAARSRLAWRGRRPGLRGRGGDDPLPDAVDPARAPAADDGAPWDVTQALADLPERYRLAMVLKYVHDLSLADIAEITGEGVATVKTHLHRGRAALRAQWEARETPVSTSRTTE